MTTTLVTTHRYHDDIQKYIRTFFKAEKDLVDDDDAFLENNDFSFFKDNDEVTWEDAFENGGAFKLRTDASRHARQLFENFSSKTPIFRNFKITKRNFITSALQIHPSVVDSKKTTSVYFMISPPVGGESSFKGESELEDKIGYVFRLPLHVVENLKETSPEDDEEDSAIVAVVSLISFRHVEFLSETFRNVFIEPVKAEWMIKRQYKKLNGF